MGSLIHELGHCLNLAHTKQGIMARGFDDLDRFFVSSEKYDETQLQMTDCHENSSLDSCRRRQKFRKVVSDCGGAFWEFNCANILYCHR